MTGRDDSIRATRERLLRVLEAYGADPVRWPEDERDALARRLAAHDREALMALQRESALDGLLDRLPAPPAPAGMEARILAAAGVAQRDGAEIVDLPSRRRPLPRGRRRAPLPLRPAIGVLAASLLLGMAVGVTTLADPFYLDLFAPQETELRDLETALVGTIDEADSEGGLL